MKILIKSKSLLSLEADEIKVVSLLCAYAFLIGQSRFYSFIPSQALFLKSYDASALPYVYIFSAIATVFVGSLYLKLTQFVPSQHMAFYTLLGIGLINSLVWFSLTMEGLRWPAMVALSWHFLLFSLTSMAFWNVASKLLDIRQGKRLFALITTGELIAFALGGFISNAWVQFWPTSHLMLINVTSLFSSAVMVRYLNQRYQHRFSQVELSSPAEKKSPTKARVRFDKYTILLILYFSASEFLYFFMDNAFYIGVQQQYETAESIAALMGTYLAIAALVGFLVRTFVAGKLIQHYGIGIAVLAFPGLVLAGSTLVLLSDMLHFTPLVFWFLFTTRVFEKLMRGIQYSSLVTLYKPLMNRHTPTQNFTEGVAIPCIGGVSGLVLLAIFHFSDVGYIGLTYGLALICLIWLVISFWLNREYINRLPQSLVRRKLDAQPDTLSHHDTLVDDFQDKTSLDSVRQGLHDPHSEIVMHSLDYLESASVKDYGQVLLDLIHHPDPDIRLDVLDRIERGHHTEAFSTLHPLIETETNFLVQRRLIRVCTSLDAKGVSIGIRYLTHDNDTVVQEAMVGLLRSGNMEGIIRAGAILIQKLNSPADQDRLIAAKVLGKAKIAGFHQTILQLLNDASDEVRKEALLNASHLMQPALLPSLLSHLEDPRFRSAAGIALLHYGEGAIPEIERSLPRFQEDEDTLMHLMRLVGLMRGITACEFLLRHLDVSNEDIRHTIAVALDTALYRSSDEQTSLIDRQIENEVEDAQWAYTSMQDIQNAPQAAILERALKNEVSQNQKRILLFLSFLYDRTTVHLVLDNFSLGALEIKAHALELLDHHIPRKLRNRIFPIFEEKSLEDRLQALSEFRKIHRLDYPERLREMLVHDKWITTWTQCCALQVVVNEQRFDLVNEVERLMFARKQSVREMAIWALIQLNKANNQPVHKEAFYQRNDPIFSELLNDDFLTIVQKTLWIKTIDIFASIEEDILANIVPSFDELKVPANETIFQEGDAGDSMYVVYSGEVGVFRDGQLIKKRGPNHTFGVTTVLVDEPRATTIQTLQPTRLFRLRREVLFELIQQNIEIAKKLIQSIFKRLMSHH